jgi:molybdopterin-dependent oxidoreductase alpha subunit
VLDHGFIAAHTGGFEALADEVRALDWARIEAVTGLTATEFDVAARLYAAADAVIVAYGMGITQHRHGTGNVQQIANLLLLRGNLGRTGAGICPVRGHSNVQGDRTVGINERPPPEFLDRLDAAFGIRSPRAPGVTVVECIDAMAGGRIRALVSLGGNFAVAAPDPEATAAALGRLDLVVGIHTKLNRSHLLHRGDALILPCLGRTDRDVQAGGPQAVTVEDSMSMVHASRGFRAPPSPELRSEPAIVGGLARATLPASRVPWADLVADYGRIRQRIEQVVPGFERYNERILRPGGFHLRNPAAEREWRVPGGRARFLPLGATAEDAPAGFPLRLTTVRSHDQYNTTIYGFDDRYRGVYGRRDVLFMNAADIAALGLLPGARIDVLGSGGARRLAGLVVVPYAIAAGSCAAYYPEAMPLIAIDDHDPASFTPAYKSVWVRVERAAPGA